MKTGLNYTRRAQKMVKQPFELFIIALTDLHESESKEWVVRRKQRS
jgi:hypothetical protein